ncbi:hypothetical protein ACFWZW_15070, partial [Microbacterium enclense]|uniref:hypothetical protein n=2 Tax=Bacillati TaxID=1783272 RepID=UPI0036DA0C6C
MSQTLIESVMQEQIAGLRASAAMFLQQRADALSQAQASETSAAGATARAEALEAALSDYLALSAPETPDTG